MCVHIIVKGKVQGVFYRASAMDKAIELSLTGWVKNTSEGNVELLACGSDEQVRKFISWCWLGPSGAVVTDVIIQSVTQEKPVGFKIIKGH